MITSATFLNLAQHLGRLRQLAFEESVSFEYLVAFSHGQVELSLKLIERCDLGLGLAHLLGTLLAELVVVGSKQRDLFKEDVILFSQQMNPLSTVTRVLTALFASVTITDSNICRLFSSELLQGGGIGPSFLDEAKVLSLFDFETGDESLIL